MLFALIISTSSFDYNLDTKRQEFTMLSYADLPERNKNNKATTTVDDRDYTLKVEPKTKIIMFYETPQPQKSKKEKKKEKEKKGKNTRNAYNLSRKSR